jgi:hypothetical protein
MKQTMLAVCGALAASLALAGCNPSSTPDGGTGDDAGTDVQVDGGTGQTVQVDADITTDTTWTTGNTYVLGKHIYVGTGELSATVTKLTIEPGVTVKGGSGTSLVVTRNGQLNAVGTLAQPIVFTSAKTVGDRTRGDWGGVVMLGRGVANFAGQADAGIAGGEAFIEGFPAAGSKTLYGAPAAQQDAAWKCGELKYVRIEFAGYQLAPNNELNSLTLGACGSGTTLDYVQVHKGLDDGIECFGGASRIKHAVISAHHDDGLDWDNGFQGKVQFLVVSQESAHGACGIEADNDATGSNASPQSFPEVWNITLVGRSLTPPATEDGNSNRGMHLRRNTGVKMGNSVVTGFGNLGLQIESTGTANALDGGTGYIKSSIFWKNPSDGWTNDVIGLDDGGTSNVDATGAKDNGFDEAAYLAGEGMGNRQVDPGFPAFSASAPNVKPATGSAAFSGYAAPPSDGFFENVTYVGAVGTDDWTTGWTAYPAD